MVLKDYVLQPLSGEKRKSKERYPHLNQPITLSIDAPAQSPAVSRAYTKQRINMSYGRFLCTILVVVLLCVIAALVLALFLLEQEPVVRSNPFNLETWKRRTTTITPNITQEKNNILDKLCKLLDVKLYKNNNALIAELKNIAQTVVTTIIQKIQHEVKQFNMNTLAVHEENVKNELMGMKTNVKIEQLEKKNHELETALSHVRNKLQENLDRKDTQFNTNTLPVHEDTFRNELISKKMHVKLEQLEKKNKVLEIALREVHNKLKENLNRESNNRLVYIKNHEHPEDRSEAGSIQGLVPNDLSDSKDTNIKLGKLEKKRDDLRNEVEEQQLKHENYDEEVELMHEYSENFKKELTPGIGIIPIEKVIPIETSTTKMVVEWSIGQTEDERELENEGDLQETTDKRHLVTPKIKKIIVNSKLGNEEGSMSTKIWAVQQSVDEREDRDVQNEEYHETTDKYYVTKLTDDIKKIIVNNNLGDVEGLPGMAVIRADRHGNFKYEVKNLLFI